MLYVILFLSTFSFAQENCSRDELVQQCYSQLCSSRQNVPTSPESLLAEIDSNPGQIPAPAIAAIRNYTGTLRDARAAIATPQSDAAYSSFVDSIINDSEHGGERLTALFGRMVTYNDEGTPVINSLLTPEESAVARQSIDLINDDVNFSIAENNLMGTDLSAIQDTDKTILNNLINFYSTSEPVRAADLREYQRLMNANTPVPADLTARIDFHSIIPALRRNFLSTKRELITNIIRANERIAVAQVSDNRFNEIINSCQISHYVVEKARSLNTPENIRRMATSVFARLNTNLYPKLSEHSAGILRNLLKPEVVTPVRTNEQFAQFNVPVLSANPTREQQLTYLNDIGRRRCSPEFIGGDNAGLEDETKLLIQVSPLTLAQNGEAALAHELGHAVTAILQNNSLSTESLAKITRLRSCLNQGHAGDQSPPSGRGVSIAGDKLRTDEDFGDWMAATLGYDADYVGCDLGRILDYGETERHSLYFSNPNDSHSADLFRNLHIRLLRGQPITSQCQELMNQSPEERPQRCEL